jgi:hypothetical protein
MLKSIICSCLAALLLPCAAQAEVSKVGISGKVLDESNRPVKHALVVFEDRDTHVSVKTHSDGRGNIEVWHMPAARCSVHVLPPAKSGLAQVFLPDVPLAEGRHLLLKVERGFVVKGHVLCDGKPARGMKVSVTPVDGDAKHNSGEAFTDGHGAFQLVLTPGQKTFEFSDEHHPGGAIFYRQEFAVTADSAMADVVIPPTAMSGIGK